ncbi:hypothetical protein CLAFUW4_07834 [Fulvia fulva]|uniref:F-box domain-containing protein n=1 Tax=Passalora fulva TaxID=5499 RepID=A0A9Q8LCT8_PASFU|nr:uncharacterized protein CLAFUR5_07958 [Fulvia fulva]KAK4629083.1 hypothetical protein CLAFUR4_07839 [Fulvia fulva]KAK4630420.1 hypothetical protein CLAFUR0_07836 [Fulvia fulva]UJO15125.1 hypothetical protein CLAFUR5_07958 [Fulvia fulva]WPV12199.1 hypothetical protein CLAFUW4_07834 [Fulvia fulva]WPV27576.1 hypothetical protein CLAFUW7_07835 [Fulvia fulva]
MTPAAKAVLETYELLEQILLHLPSTFGTSERSHLRTCQQVCRYWRDIIDDSTALHNELQFDRWGPIASLSTPFCRAYRVRLREESVRNAGRVRLEEALFRIEGGVGEVETMEVETMEVGTMEANMRRHRLESAGGRVVPKIRVGKKWWRAKRARE